MSPPHLALLDEPGFGDAIIFCGNAEPTRRVAGGCVHAPDYFCEPVGAAFAARYDFAGGSEASPTGGTGRRRGRGRDSESDSEAGEEYGKSGKSGPKASGFLKLSEGLKGVNLYDLLGCSEGASQDEIRKAYRSLALVAHPDKQTSQTSEEEMKAVQERFVQIQEAYELLSDPAKRLQFDSSLPFDQTLPRYKPGQGEDFFEVFADAFRRNARFSVKRPVPDLGSMDTKPDDWKKFYNFWYEFQSWRDPVVLAQMAGEDICDLNDAECREERRWMQRENERVAKKYKQQERDRISELVRMAEKYDPRIQAEKDAKKAAKQAEAIRRQEELNALQRAKDEAERKKRLEEEAAKALEDEKRRIEKAAREAVKTQVKQARQRLRSFHPAVRQFVLLDQLNEVCLKLDEPDLRRLGDNVEQALKKGVADGAAVFHKAIEGIGLKPVTQVKDEDTASTSSGPSSHEKEDKRVEAREDPEVLRKRQQEEQRREAQARARREKEEAAAAEERAKREAEKAEERRKKEDIKRKEQQMADTLKRQQEKKEEQKAKKAEEKKKKDEEQEVLRRQQKKEEDKLKAQEQAEADRLAAQARLQEAEIERQLQRYTADRTGRLTKLDQMPEEELVQSVRDACSSDPALAGALRAVKERSGDAGEEVQLERLMVLLSKEQVSSRVWHLAIGPPEHLRPPNTVRNQVKKAKQRLQKVAAAFLAEAPFAAADMSAASEWQLGIATGDLEVPTWSIEELEAEERAAKEAQAKAAEEDAKGKKPKKAKEAKPKGEPEDLDKLLAEFQEPAAAGDGKKGGKKKK